MSSTVYVESSKKKASAAHCEECEGLNENGSFYDGEARIKEHAESFPLHTRISYARLEVV